MCLHLHNGCIDYRIHVVINIFIIILITKRSKLSKQLKSLVSPNSPLSSIDIGNWVILFVQILLFTDYKLAKYKIRTLYNIFKLLTE